MRARQGLKAKNFTTKLNDNHPGTGLRQSEMQKSQHFSNEFSPFRDGQESEYRQIQVLSNKDDSTRVFSPGV